MTEQHGRWTARPRLAALLRLFVLIVPAVTGTLAAWAVADALSDPSGFWPTLAWWAALIGAALAAILVTQRLARRLLPLSWLLTLTLSFPDRAPSRLRTARRAARRRSLERTVESTRRDGLGATPDAATSQALVLVTALGEHDRRTRGHSERVRGFADILAEEVGVSGADRDKLRWGALLHDIGKLSVPGEILNKPGRPDEAEWATLQRHPAEGEHLVEPLHDWLGPWAGAVAEHHEHWDGTGYPRGLAGEDISLGGRILAIADAYEVMTAARAYKAPMRPEAARQALVADAGSHFDPVLVRSFLALSLGRLWFVIGGSTVLSVLPWLARIWTAPAGASARRGLSGPATATAAVAGLALAGVVNPSGQLAIHTPPAPPRVESAAPPAPQTTAPPAPDPAPVTVPEAEPPVPPVTARGVVPPPVPEPATAPDSPGGPAGPGGDTTPPGEATTEPSAPETPPATPPHEPSAPGPPRFSARGQLLAPALLRLSESWLQLDCGPSGPMGLDALVFELPAVNRVQGAPVVVTGQDLLGLHNLEVAFYSADCQVLGRLDGPGADAAGSLPGGVAFVVVGDRSGLVTSVQLSVG